MFHVIGWLIRFLALGSLVALIACSGGTLPPQVIAAASLKGVSAGSSSTCVLQAGTLYCYGNATGAGVPAKDFIPLSPGGLGTVKEVSLANADDFIDGCAIADVPATSSTPAKSGAVFCWVGPSSPTAIVDSNHAQLTGMRGITAGGGVDCAIRIQDYSVYCWHAPLGMSSQYLDTAGPVANLGSYKMLQVSAGGNFVCGVGIDSTTGNQRLVCWGVNDQGQLGRGTVSTGDLPAAPVPNLTARQVSAGWRHACAILTDNSVRCWGANDSGQVGIGTTGGPPISVPQQVGGLPYPQVISAGVEFTCALLSDQSARCWGRNTVGQLGIGPKISGGSVNGSQVTLEFSSPQSVSRPTPVKGLAGFLGISAGAGHACAAGLAVVRCWGDNSQGELTAPSLGSCGTAATPCSIEPVP